MGWVVLIYKVPTEPTKYRASVWREIKRLGGVYLQGGVVVFPDIDDVLLNVTSLGDMIRGFGGTEYTFVTHSMPSSKEQSLAAEFCAARNEEYAALMAACHPLLSLPLQDLPADIGNLQDSYKKLKKAAGVIKARDYFDAPLGMQLTHTLDLLRTRMTVLTRGDHSQ